jgi:hypothetical protein
VYITFQHVTLRHQHPLPSQHALDMVVDLPTHQEDATTRRPARTPTSASSSRALHMKPEGWPLRARHPLPSTYLADAAPVPGSPAHDAPGDMATMPAPSCPSSLALYKPPPRPGTSPHNSAASLSPPSTSLSPSSQLTGANKLAGGHTKSRPNFHHHSHQALHHFEALENPFPTHLTPP